MITECMAWSQSYLGQLRSSFGFKGVLDHCLYHRASKISNCTFKDFWYWQISLLKSAIRPARALQNWSPLQRNGLACSGDTFHMLLLFKVALFSSILFLIDPGAGSLNTCKCELLYSERNFFARKYAGQKRVAVCNASTTRLYLLNLFHGFQLYPLPRNTFLWRGMCSLAGKNFNHLHSDLEL